MGEPLSGADVAGLVQGEDHGLGLFDAAVANGLTVVQGDVAAFGKAATVVGAHVTRTIGLGHPCNGSGPTEPGVSCLHRNVLGVSVRLWVR